MSLYTPGFQRQVFKPSKTLSKQSKEMKKQKKNKGSVLVAESAYNSQNAQFGLVMKYPKIYRKYQNKILFGLSMLKGTGADLGFSREMEDFRSTKLIFRALKNN